MKKTFLERRWMMCAIFVLLAILFFQALDFRDVLPTSSALGITVETDKGNYYLREKVMIEGNLTMDGSPVSDACIAVQVDTPIQTLVYRTLTIGNPQELWRIEITSMSLSDFDFNPINVAKIENHVCFRVKVTNHYPPDLSQAVITVNVYDASIISLGALSTTVNVPFQQSRQVSFYIRIPSWACSGPAIAVFNVYTNKPEYGGFPIAQQEILTFHISRREQGWFQLDSLSLDLPDNINEQTYSTFFRLNPEPEPGTYTLHTSGAVNPIERSSSNTIFNVDSYPSPPQASFSYSPPKIYPNMTVTFDASSSSAEGYGDFITRYEWNFGDNTPPIIKTGNATDPPNPLVTHAFSNSKTYVVTLNVTDNENLWSTTSKPITISNTNPIAAFEWTPQVALINQTVTFDATSSQPGWDAKTVNFSSISNYTWNFDDATGVFTVTTATTTHKYTAPDNYTVTLTITDSIGQQDTTSHIIQILNITLIGDITGPEGVPDGIVDIDDVVFVAVHFGLTEGDPGWDPRADITGPEYLVPDGLVDIDDVTLVAIHFGEHV